MAKIIKVGPSVTPKTSNSFRASVKTTNPFKYSNFEGNTLQFADVFEGFEPKKINKLKLIASSVAGSINKFRTGITEPIKVFACRVRDGVSAAWDYAVNTNVKDLPGVKDFSDKVSALKEGVTNAIASKTEFLNMDVTEIGKLVSGKWHSIVSKYVHSGSGISSETSVADLETMWKEINAEGVVA